MYPIRGRRHSTSHFEYWHRRHNFCKEIPCCANIDVHAWYIEEFQNYTYFCIIISVIIYHSVHVNILWKKKFLHQLTLLSRIKQTKTNSVAELEWLFIKSLFYSTSKKSAKAAGQTPQEQDLPLDVHLFSIRILFVGIGCPKKTLFSQIASV